jgi:hypothetical protein
MNGNDQRPASSMSIPAWRSALIISPMGRRSAVGSAVMVTSPSASPANGVTNRITVPAWPQSTTPPPHSRSGGVTLRSSPDSPGIASMRTPSARSAWTIRDVSSESSGARTVPGPSAMAASTSSRAVRDFDPGMGTSASTAPAAVGAGQDAATAGE